jgi:short-subunit dehydrogenase
MAPAGGVIVNISSMSAQLPSPFLSVYSATKAGVAAFTRSVQTELDAAKSPVRTLLVSPGFLDTAMLKQPDANRPASMEWLVESPEAAAAAIADAIEAGHTELVPDGGGRLMRWLQALAPGLVRAGAKHLLSPKKLR